jgi:hypothetical protein
MLGEGDACRQRSKWTWAFFYPPPQKLRSTGRDTVVVNYELVLIEKCVNFGAELIAMSAINAVTDFVLLVLPMPRLWGLHTSLNKKIQLMAIFALGAALVNSRTFKC